MDTTIAGLFNEYQGLTGSAVAAATLVLAQLQTTQHRSATDAPRDRLINLKEAAAYLGYDVAGLRKIVTQKRIRYVQNGRGPIRFRREWLDEFIAAHSRGPQDIERAPTQKRSKPRPATQPKLGYDSSLYLR